MEVASDGWTGADVVRAVYHRAMGAGWFTRRSVVLHALVLVVVPACLVAFWWQLHQALAGNGLSWAYTVEWPVFAIIAVVAWWQLLHENSEERAGRAERAAQDVEVVRASVPQATGADDPGQEYVAKIQAAAAHEYQLHVARHVDLDSPYDPHTV